MKAHFLFSELVSTIIRMAEVSGTVLQEIPSYTVRSKGLNGDKILKFA